MTTLGISNQRVEPRAGIFIGNVKLKADHDFQDVELKSRVDEISFAPPVQKLMTNGGDIGLTSAEAELRMKKGRLSFLKGLLRIDSMNVEGMSLSKTKATIDWNQGEVVLNTQIKALRVGVDSPEPTP